MTIDMPRELVLVLEALPRIQPSPAQATTLAMLGLIVRYDGRWYKTTSVWGEQAGQPRKPRS